MCLRQQGGLPGLFPTHKVSLVRASCLSTCIPAQPRCLASTLSCREEDPGEEEEDAQLLPRFNNQAGLFSPMAAAPQGGQGCWLGL